MRRSAGGFSRKRAQLRARSATKAIRSATGAVADEIGFRFGVTAERRLERNGARQNAAIDFGQRDIHRKIARAQSARAGTP